MTKAETSGGSSRIWERLARLALFTVVIVSTLSAQAGVLNDADVRKTKAAFAAVEAGLWKKARRLVAKVEDPLPAKIVKWFDFTRLGTDASFEAIARFTVNSPGWPRRDLLQRRAEEAMTSKTPNETVLAWFAGRRPLSTDGRIRYGAALRATGAKDTGWAVLRDAWINGNFGKRQEKDFYRRYRKLISREDHLARLDRLIWQGHYWQARRMLWKVNARYRLLALARLMLMRREGNVDTAIAKVPKDLLDHPGLVYERLRWRRRKGKDTALELLANPPADLVRPEKWWTERSILARRVLRKGHVSKAYNIIQDHGLSAGPAFADAEWMAGWIALRFLGDQEAALKHFSTMFNAVKYPVSRARGAYWAARAVEAMGRSQAAKRLYAAAARHITTYYGQLAATRLEPEGAMWLPPDPDPSFSELESFEAHELVRVVRVLSQIDENQRLRAFILGLGAVDDSPAWRVLTASLARAHKRPDLAILIAKQTHRAGTKLIDAGYPMLVPAVVENKSGDPVIEKPLVLAVVRQESAFYSEATSRSGARGLMQLLPRTARKVAKKLKEPYSRRRLTMDPQFNLKLGQAYLSNLIEVFDGSYILALAAYNAGPGQARKWMRANGDPRDSLSAAIDWIEMIPFDETRNYIQRVMEGLQVYRGRLNGTRIAITLERDLRR